MIPLMYVLPTNEIYTPASGIVTKITPVYSHYRHSIQVEFKYNLDEFFYLEIGLSEFDQPSEISLYGFFNSHKMQMSDMQEEYHLMGKKVSVVLSKDVILEIANNIVTPDSFEEGATISFNIIQDKQDVKDRAVVSHISILPMSIELRVNDVDMVYSVGTKDTSYEPTLSVAGLRKTPDVVDGHYNIFHLDGVNDGMSFISIPPQDYENHYLFRQLPSLLELDILDEKTLSVGGVNYRYGNGMIEYFGMTISMQEFLVMGDNEQYKTYIFNSARDRNLYSEISLLFPAIQHNSMTVYDLDKNILIKGKVDYAAILDEETDKLLFSVKMTNCRDFFGRDVSSEFEFRFSPEKVLSRNIDAVKNATEIGSFFVKDVSTGDVSVVPTDGRPIDIQKKSYITASNNRYSFSIKKESLLKHSREMRGNYKNFKSITGGDFLSPLYRFDTVDFEQNTIIVKNGTKSVKKGIDELNSIMISTGDSRLDTKDHLTDFAGIEFNIAPDQITSSGIDITNFGDYVMLCRIVEDATYGIAGIRKDTYDLMYSLTLSYARTDITMIYNKQKDKVYYIDFAKKETGDNSSDLPITIQSFISSVDEKKLKKFLLDGGFAIFNAYQTPNSSFVTLNSGSLYFEDIMREKYLDQSNNIASVFTSSKGVTDFDVLANSSSVSGTYIPRPSKVSVMKRSFGRDTTVFRKIATGIYANKTVDVIGISIADSSLTISFTEDGETHYSTIQVDGGPIEMKRGLKKSIVDDSENYSYMSGYTYMSDIQHDNIFQVSNVLVVESALGISIAFDINIIEMILSNNMLGINGTVSLSYDNKMFMVSNIDSDTLAVSDGMFTCGDVSFDMMSPTGEAKALSFDGDNGDVSTTISNDEYDTLLSAWDFREHDDNGFTSIDEFTLSEAYGIAFDIEKAQYLQFKE
jgi:hypothetical protein